MARAPVPGAAKTRLIPVLGAARAAALHQRLARETVAAAVAAGTGPVTLWAHPSPDHAFFRRCRRRFGVVLAAQRGADLGERMLTAVVHGLEAAPAVLVIGTDCPALTPETLGEAATALARGADAVLLPVDDGGYALIGLRAPEPAVFRGIAWGGPSVLHETARRMDALGWRVRLLPPTWDLDRPEDLARLAAWRRARRMASPAA